MSLEFSLDHLQQAYQFLCRQVPTCNEWVVAYSGGLDSHVLLHVLARMRQQFSLPVVRAVHINHGLHPYAAQWAQHCQQVCHILNIPLQGYQLALAPQAGDSIEALARTHRYHYLSQTLQATSCLLTAHHQDDQAETVLLQLLRGAGPKGLAAMPIIQSLGAGILCRPLLALTRAQLQHYANRHALQWVEDSSNHSTAFARNYLRHQIMPLLQQRWPGTSRCLQRAARHCAQTATLLDELAAQDLETLQLTSTAAVFADSASLDRQRLCSLSLARQCNVLRYWIRCYQRVVPNEARLLTFLQQLAVSAWDKMPQLHWNGNVLVGYGNRLYCLPAKVLQDVDYIVPISWDLQSPLLLPHGLGTLLVHTATDGGLKIELQQQGIQVRFRQGGERIRPIGYRCSKSLKQLWQEWQVPPWQRSRIPLLYAHGQLVAVVGYGVSTDAAAIDQPGFIVHLQREGS